MLNEIHRYYVYIVANCPNGVLYVGVTSDILSRIWEHKQKVYSGFTSKYNCNKLMYYEEYQWINDAIDREKQLKAAAGKLKLI